MSYIIGQMADLTAAFADGGGAAIDPTTVSIDVTTPDLVVTTYTYPANITKTSVGNYNFLYPITQAGDHSYRWYSTGTGQTAFNGSFYVQPVAPPGLVSLTEAKEWLGISDNTQDGLITRLIQAASRAVGNYLNRPTLFSQSYVETYDGTNSRVLCPINFPITAVTSLTIDGAAVSQVTDMLSDGYRVTPTNLVMNGSRRFTAGRGNVAITYTAGYATIPDDMQQACLMTLQSMVQAQTVDTTVSSESTAGYSVSYRATGAGRVTEDAKELLKTYRRVTW